MDLESQAAQQERIWQIISIRTGHYLTKRFQLSKMAGKISVTAAEFAVTGGIIKGVQVFAKSEQAFAIIARLRQNKKVASFLMLEMS